MDDRFLKDSKSKQLIIKYDGITLYNSSFKEESMELVEKLCSKDNLTFGSCEASSFTIRILDTVAPLKGKKLEVSMLVDGYEEPTPIGYYTVASDKPTADRRYRDIVAYDDMEKIINSEVSSWYNELFPTEESTCTLKEMRKSFLSYFGIDEEEKDLVNDNIIIHKTVNPSELSGNTVITCMCELNGCFGHIGSNGKFQNIVLSEIIEGLYPSDSLFPQDNLYPRDDSSNIIQIYKEHYISCKYEDYETQRIDKVVIRKEENDIGGAYPLDQKSLNTYIIQDNFLVYGMEQNELNEISRRIFSVIGKIHYRPATLDAKGNPYRKLGDAIKLTTTYEIVYTYVLQRTLKGIQALKDTYEALGKETYEEQSNSIRKSILQLRGKTNLLARTIEENRLEIIDITDGLSSKITQTADKIEAEVRRASKAEGDLAASIKINADAIITKVSKNNIVSEINQSAEKITITASKIDLNGLVNANEFISKYATINTLNAETARIDKLESDHLTAADLEVINAKFENINADNITAGTITADRIQITGSSGVASKVANDSHLSNKYETIERINSLLNDRMQVTGYIGIAGNFTFKNEDVAWGTVAGVRCLVSAGR